MPPELKRTLTSLQNIEERIRKLFGTAGDIGASFSPNLSISLDGGSLTEPGSQTFRGKHWGCVFQLFGNIANSAGIKPSVAVIVDGFEFYDAAGARQLRVRYTPPGGADPIAMGGNLTFWREQVAAVADVPPFATNAAVIGSTSTGTLMWVSNSSVNAIMAPSKPYKIHLPAGSRLTFTNEAAGANTDAFCTVWGRIY